MAGLVDVERLVPPIFVVPTDGAVDLFVYFKVRDAEGDLEPVDVLNHEYELYDGEGRELSASVHGRQTVISSDGRPARAALTDRLRRFFEATEIDTPPQDDWKAFVDSSAKAVEEWQRACTRRR